MPATAISTALRWNPGMSEPGILKVGDDLEDRLHRLVGRELQRGLQRFR